LNNLFELFNGQQESDVALLLGFVAICSEHLLGLAHGAGLTDSIVETLCCHL
jgi:hypothetical protein